jgi:hypothetical protein
VALPQLAAHLEAMDVREAHVEDDNRRRIGRSERKGMLAVSRLDWVVRRSSERPCQ